MSGKTIDPKVARRRLFVRAGLVVVYILLVWATFVFGKGHTILVDNKPSKDGSVSAIDGVMVSIDGREALELYAGDRDMVLVKGQRHRVSVELVTGERKIDKMSFTLPIDTDVLLLSVPKLAAGQENYIEPFVQRDQPRPADEQVGDSNAFTSPGGETDPATTAP